MRAIFFIAILFSVIISALSQEAVIILHPSVGDTIDKIEKTTYYLFPDVNDSIYQSGVIYTAEDSFILHFNTLSGLMTLVLDSTEILKAKNNIEKIIQYQATMAKRDTISHSCDVRLLKGDSCIRQFNMNFMPPDKMKRMAKEARRYQHLNNRANDMGLWGKEKDDFIKQSNHIELYSTKKKKKKNK